MGQRIQTTLLNKVEMTSLYNKCIQNFFFIPVYKSSLFSQYPTYMRNMFAILHTTYNRSSHVLSLSKTRTTINGLLSFSYFSAKQWNAFPEELRKGIFPDFKQRVQSLNMFDYSFSNFSLVLCIYLLIFI